MNKRYVFGIIITVLVLAVNQVFIQYWLKQKRLDANTINVAGKQRMLSQRITAEFYTIKEESKSKDFLDQLVNEWTEAHVLLQSRLSKDDSEISQAIIKDLKNLDGYMDFIQEHSEHADSTHLHLTSIAKNQNAFLADMDAIVKRLEQDSDRKLDTIVWIEYLLFFITLLILVLEVFYIYKPIEKKLKESSLVLEDSNEKLNLAFEKIKAKNKELNEVTYIASHDLQEPLRTVSSMVDMLNTKYDDRLDEQGQKMLGFLDSASNRMRNLVKDLLEYSILGQDKSLVLVDCNDLLDDLSKDLQGIITKRNATIEWKKLPTVMAYKSELRLLFQNLITNGIKFQDPDNTPQIKIESEDQGDFWQFKISDNGIGIKKEHQEKIFEIFKRMHAQDVYKGTGIGLAHCKKIVELHDGKLWVNSEAGSGSDFYFTIKKEIVNLQ